MVDGVNGTTIFGEPACNSTHCRNKTNSVVFSALASKLNLKLDSPIERVQGESFYSPKIEGKVESLEDDVTSLEAAADRIANASVTIPSNAKVNLETDFVVTSNISDDVREKMQDTMRGITESINRTVRTMFAASNSDASDEFDLREASPFMHNVTKEVDRALTGRVQAFRNVDAQDRFVPSEKGRFLKYVPDSHGHTDRTPHFETDLHLKKVFKETERPTVRVNKYDKVQGLEQPPLWNKHVGPNTVAIQGLRQAGRTAGDMTSSLDENVTAGAPGVEDAIGALVPEYDANVSKIASEQNMSLGGAAYVMGSRVSNDTNVNDRAESSAGTLNEHYENVLNLRATDQLPVGQDHTAMKPVGGRARFPAHWGEPPRDRSPDLNVLPYSFGVGSATVGKWITEKVEQDQLHMMAPSEQPRPTFETGKASDSEYRKMMMEANHPAYPAKPADYDLAKAEAVVTLSGLQWPEVEGPDFDKYTTAFKADVLRTLFSRHASKVTILNVETRMGFSKVTFDAEGVTDLASKVGRMSVISLEELNGGKMVKVSEATSAPFDLSERHDTLSELHQQGQVWTAARKSGVEPPKVEEKPQPRPEWNDTYILERNATFHEWRENISAMKTGDTAFGSINTIQVKKPCPKTAVEEEPTELVKKVRGIVAEVRSIEKTTGGADTESKAKQFLKTVEQYREGEEEEDDDEEGAHAKKSIKAQLLALHNMSKSNNTDAFDPALAHSIDHQTMIAVMLKALQDHHANGTMDQFKPDAVITVFLKKETLNVNLTYAVGTDEFEELAQHIEKDFAAATNMSTDESAHLFKLAYANQTDSEMFGKGIIIKVNVQSNPGYNDVEKYVEAIQDQMGVNGSSIMDGNVTRDLHPSMFKADFTDVGEDVKRSHEMLSKVVKRFEENPQAKPEGGFAQDINETRSHLIKMGGNEEQISTGIRHLVRLLAGVDRNLTKAYANETADNLQLTAEQAPHALLKQMADAHSKKKGTASLSDIAKKYAKVARLEKAIKVRDELQEHAHHMQDELAQVKAGADMDLNYAGMQKNVSDALFTLAEAEDNVTLARGLAPCQGRQLKIEKLQGMIADATASGNNEHLEMYNSRLFSAMSDDDMGDGCNQTNTTSNATSSDDSSDTNQTNSSSLLPEDAATMASFHRVVKKLIRTTASEQDTVLINNKKAVEGEIKRAEQESRAHVTGSTDASIAGVALPQIKYFYSEARKHCNLSTEEAYDTPDAETQATNDELMDSLISVTHNSSLVRVGGQIMVPFKTYFEKAKTLENYANKTVQDLWKIYHGVILNKTAASPCIGHGQLAALLAGVVGDNIGSKHTTNASKTAVDKVKILDGYIREKAAAIPQWKVHSVLTKLRLGKKDRKESAEAVKKLMDEDGDDEEEFGDKLAQDHQAFEYLTDKDVHKIALKEVEEGQADKMIKSPKYTYGQVDDIHTDEQEKDIDDQMFRIKAVNAKVKGEVQMMKDVDSITGLRPGDETAKEAGLHDVAVVENRRIKYTPGEHEGRPIESVDSSPDVKVVEDSRR